MKKKDNKKYLFLNPSSSHYRKGFYQELSKLINVKFLFYFKDAETCKGINYEILKGEHKIPCYVRGFTPMIAWKALTEDYDVIINSDPFSFATHITFLIAKLRRKKFVIWNENWVDPKTKSAKFINPYINYIISHTDLCIAAGTKAMKWLFYKGAKNIRGVFNSGEDMMGLVTKKQKENFFLFVGSIHRVKGVKTFVQACNELNVPFKIVTNNIHGDYLEKFIQDIPHEDLHINICRKEIANLMYACKAFVLPSQVVEGNTGIESWGMVLNEALSCNAPLIGSDKTGASHDVIIEDVNGTMFKGGDKEDLKRCIKLHLKNKYDGSREMYLTLFNHKEMAKEFKNALEIIE